MLPIVEAEIHPDAIVPCALMDFKMRKATACLKCTHFAGLGQMNNDPTQPWHRRYAIRCGHVMERRTYILTEAEE